MDLSVQCHVRATGTRPCVKDRRKCFLPAHARPGRCIHRLPMLKFQSEKQRWDHRSKPSDRNSALISSPYRFPEPRAGGEGFLRGPIGKQRDRNYHRTGTSPPAAHDQCSTVTASRCSDLAGSYANKTFRHSCIGSVRRRFHRSCNTFGRVARRAPFFLVASRAVEFPA